MKKWIGFIVTATTVCLIAAGIAAASGISVFGKANIAREAPSLREDAWIVLKGTIERMERAGHYVLKDFSGEILLDIEQKVLNGIVLSPGDRVEVAGRVEEPGNRVQVDVKAIQKDGEAIRYVTIEDAKRMHEESWVVIRGYVKQHIRKNKYTFDDTTGEITIEVDTDVWNGLIVNHDELVEIRGETDEDKIHGERVVTIDVEYIRALKQIKE